MNTRRFFVLFVILIAGIVLAGCGANYTAQSVKDVSSKTLLKQYTQLEEKGSTADQEKIVRNELHR